jgi:predicted nucleotidyltransferase
VTSTILERNERDPLYGKTPAQLEQALRAALAGRVESAWFFGSYGTPRFGSDSDVDLMLVARTTLPFPERPHAFADLLDLVPRMDILVYTPEEFERLTTDPSPGFWRSVTQSLRRLV